MKVKPSLQNRSYKELVNRFKESKHLTRQSRSLIRCAARSRFPDIFNPRDFKIKLPFSLYSYKEYKNLYENTLKISGRQASSLCAKIRYFVKLRFLEEYKTDPIWDSSKYSRRFIITYEHLVSKYKKDSKVYRPATKYRARLKFPDKFNILDFKAPLKK